MKYMPRPAAKARCQHAYGRQLLADLQDCSSAPTSQVDDRSWLRRKLEWLSALVLLAEAIGRDGQRLLHAAAAPIGWLREEPTTRGTPRMMTYPGERVR